jgi:hypothetical protein
MYLKKQDINELDWKHINSLTLDELEEFARQHLQPHKGWFLPQLVANFGSWTLDKDNLDVQQILQQNVGSDPKQQALWKLTRIPRQVLVGSQHNNPEYATLTPLILAGFKRYQGLGYDNFRGLPNIEWLVEPKLLEALVVDFDFNSLGSDRILEIRNQGLMNKTGAKAGQLKPAETTWSLTGIRDTEIGHLPKLTQTMLTQIWLAHPAKRTQSMILHPTNWDLMPEPLISMELFESTNKAVEQFKSQKHDKLLPWL